MPERTQGYYLLYPFQDTQEGKNVTDTGTSHTFMKMNQGSYNSYTQLSHHVT